MEYVSTILEIVKNQLPTSIFNRSQCIQLLLDTPVYCLETVYASKNEQEFSIIETKNLTTESTFLLISRNSP